jgi:hypothetical protein
MLAGDFRALYTLSHILFVHSRLTLPRLYTIFQRQRERGHCPFKSVISTCRIEGQFGQPLYLDMVLFKASNSYQLQILYIVLLLRLKVTFSRNLHCVTVLSQFVFPG